MLPTCHGAPVAPHPSLLPATIVRGGVVPGNLTELVCRFPVSKLIQSSGKGADRSTSWMCGQIPIPRSARNGTSAATLRRLPAAEGSWGGTLPQALSGGRKASRGRWQSQTGLGVLPRCRVSRREVTRRNASLWLSAFPTCKRRQAAGQALRRAGRRIGSNDGAVRSTPLEAEEKAPTPL